MEKGAQAERKPSSQAPLTPPTHPPTPPPPSPPPTEYHSQISSPDRTKPIEGCRSDKTREPNPKHLELKHKTTRKKQQHTNAHQTDRPHSQHLARCMYVQYHIWPPSGVLVAEYLLTYHIWPHTTRTHTRTHTTHTAPGDVLELPATTFVRVCTASCPHNGKA